MKRIVARSLPLFLLTLLAVYIALPFFGSAWHNLVPEHDHLYLGVGQTHDGPSTIFTQLNVAALSAVRLSLGFGETVVHAFNPAATLQVFAMVMGFSAMTLLRVTRGLSQRLVHAELFLRFPPLLPLDPPPVV